MNELIVFEINEKLTQNSLKHVLTTLLQKLWVNERRCFARKVLIQYISCRKLEGLCYHFATNAPVTKLQLHDSYTFYIVGVYNFSPLYMKNILRVVNCVKCRLFLWLFNLCYFERREKLCCRRSAWVCSRITYGMEGELDLVLLPWWFFLERSVCSTEET